MATDEWRGYSKLVEYGFKHETANHSKHFVNPSIKFHTQAIEKACIEGKEWMRRARRPKASMQSHLDFMSLLLLRKNHPKGYFGAFLEDVNSD